MVRFEAFELDSSSGELRKHGRRIRLQEQPLQILTLLLDRPGELVTREELRDRLWPADTFVDFDTGLNSAILRLRNALGDSAGTPRFVQTLPRRGYRFIASVQVAVPVATRRLPLTEATPEAARTARLAADGPAQPGSGQAAEPVVAAADPRRRRWRWVIAGCLVLAVAPMAYLGIRPHMGSHPKSEPPALKQSQLTANVPENHLTGAAISPDGKYLAYTDSEGLHLRALATGETRTLVGSTGEYWWAVSWFPDGVRLLVSGMTRGDGAEELFEVSALGGAPRRLREDAWGGAVSPDGMSIVFSAAKGHELWLMDATGENPRLLAQDQESQFWFPVWSPAGDRLAYVRVKNDWSEKRIETRPPQGSLARVIIADRGLGWGWGHPALCWLPEGRFLYVRNGALWAVEVNPGTGEPSSEPRRLSDGLETWVLAMSASADGKRLAILQRRGQSDVYAARVEAGGRRLVAPRRMTLDEWQDWGPRWTPDSTALLFTSDRNGTADVFRQRIEARTPELVHGGPGTERDVVVSPEGAWIMFRSTPPARDRKPPDPERLMRQPVTGGVAQTVMELRGDDRVECPRRPQASCVLGRKERDELVLHALHPLRGREGERARVKFEPEFSLGWDVSPDGARVAVVNEAFAGRVRLVDLTSGKTEDLLLKMPRSGVSLNGVKWAADGQRLFASGMVGAPTRLGLLLSVDRRGNVQVLLERPGEYLSSIAPSPDGNWLAWGTRTTEINAWLGEGY